MSHSKHTSPASSAAAFKEKTGKPTDNEYVRIWYVGVDGAPVGTFDDLDTALAALRGYLGTNGGVDSQILSELVPQDEYLSIAEKEDEA
jgi:hypothetical protein